MRYYEWLPNEEKMPTFPIYISLWNQFSFLWILPSEKWECVNEIILENFPFIYFNITSFTGMCIIINNRPTVLHKYLGTDYLLYFFFTMYCEFDLIRKHHCMNVFLKTFLNISIWNFSIVDNDCFRQLNKSVCIFFELKINEKKMLLNCNQILKKISGKFYNNTGIRSVFKILILKIYAIYISLLIDFFSVCRNKSRGILQKWTYK